MRSAVLWLGLVLQLSASFASPLDPPPAAQVLVLSQFVRHWEPAGYARGGGRRARAASVPTSSGNLPPLRLVFTAHNREFRLVLRPDPGSVFTDDVQFHSSEGPLHYDTRQVYSGTLEGDESALVYGVVTAEGLFDGTIWTPSEEYYIEPLSRYNVEHPNAHSAIYRRSDVTDPHDNSDLPCASHLLHLKRKHGSPETIFNYTHYKTLEKEKTDVKTRKRRWLPEDDPELPLDLKVPYNSQTNRNSKNKRWLPEDDMQDDEPRKNPELPLDLDVPYTSNSDPSLERGSTRKPKLKIDKSNLITKVRLDDLELNKPKPKTHVEVIKTKAGVVTVSRDVVKKEPVGWTVLGANGTDDERRVNKRATVDPKKTTCLVYLQADHMFYQRYGSEDACIEVMTRHVQKVNAIYKVTDFNQDGKPDNITFMIKRIKVHTLDALKDPSYRFPNNYGVEKYLELFSEEDYDAFCLAYMFTYRDFEMGTLGLAWTGDLKNAGGVCEKNGHYRGSMKSLNTGIVTLLNYGKHVPPAVSHVTLAHEIGHNFGSPHDPEVCTPFGEDGNYIMFARATSGDRRNNNKFSPCSLRAIDPVLNNKARSPKGCFTEPQPAICGNGVVEEGEECDCGWAGECTDVCCRPQAARPRYKPCTLTENSVCSPSQGPCCTASCTLKFGEMCRSDNGCRDAAYCDGKRPQCPASKHKPNRTRCDQELVCYMGECTGSICLAYGLESCQCAGRPGEPRSACELCCRAPGGPCKSSFQWNSPPYDVPDMHAKPGTPCNQYNGYCDVFQRCREVDPAGPLATLRRLLLSDQSLASFKKWLLDHWYAAVLVLLAVIGLLVASTRWLGRRGHKLKSVTIIHSSTTETVRLPTDTGNGLIVHTAVRSKLPLKKKVALRTRAYRNKKDAKNKPTDKQSPAHQQKKRKSTTTKAEDSRTKVIKENTAVVSTGDGKPPKHILLSKQKGKIKKRKGKLKKETIDYSAMQKDATLPHSSDSEALSKVQKWLLSSPQPAGLPKSKSTPVGLTERAHRITKPQSRKTRPSKSATNLVSGEKARLQVIYKPPFRFSVKICKSDKTKVVLDKSAKPDVERRRSDDAKAKVAKTGNRNSTEVADATVIPSVNQEAAQVVPQYADVSYANLLPRSASDCKVSKFPEVKLKHKKSSSVGQKKETTESRQNLLAKEDFESGAHFYENLAVSPDFLPKSCSMPRKSVAISRQGSQGHLPRVQSRNRLSTNNLSNSSTDIEHLYETLRRDASSTNLGARRVGGSMNNLRARQNSLASSDKPSKLKRQLSENEAANRAKLQGFHLVVGKNKLKRQLSDNELTQRVQLCMPASAPANPTDRFQWPEVRDNRVPNRASFAEDRRRSNVTVERPQTFGELKNSLPDKGERSLLDNDLSISPEDFLKIIDN